MKVLAVIDMQNDFIDGVLGTDEAIAIVNSVREKIDSYLNNGDTVVYTQDTHTENYLNTQEGRKLPVVHCVKGTPGWRIATAVAVDGCTVIEKPSFGSLELADYIASLDDVRSVELVGLCTDICVISNGMIIKARMPDTRVVVDPSCCAGVTKESHENALRAMSACQIEVLGEDRQ
jgi:nicotinamidase-related amidase